MGDQSCFCGKIHLLHASKLFLSNAIKDVQNYYCIWSNPVELMLNSLRYYQAYAEEEVRREAKERRRTEAEALSRWYQLLASLITRQRLHNCYVDGASSQSAVNIATPNDKSSLPAGGSENTRSAHLEESEIAKSNSPSIVLAENHEHVFRVEDQIVDEESSTRTKRCRCGFSVQYEEL